MDEPPGDQPGDNPSADGTAAPLGKSREARLRRQLYFLAMPVLVEYVLTYCVGLFDVFLSGQISKQATEAVGLAAYVTWLVSMLVGLVSTGTNALVSRSWGGRDFATAHRVLNRSLALACCLGVFLALGVMVAAPWLVEAVGVKEGGPAVAVRFLRLEAIGFLFVGVTLSGAAALRGSGDTRTPMKILGSVNVINMAASVTLVYGPGPIPAFGVDGIVLGTMFARMCGAVLMLVALARRHSEMRLDVAEMRLWDDTVRRILRIGVPALGESITMWSGQFLFLMIIGRLGSSAALAAHIVGVRVEDVSYLPALAFGAASATMIGQSLGAGDPATARRIAHIAARQGGLFALVGTVAFFFGADLIYRTMHESPEVAAIGVPAFRWLALFQVPQAMGLVYVYSLRGAGDTRSPMWITTIGVYGIRLPVAWLGGLVLQGGLLGAWTGMFADVTVRSLLVCLRYASGRWVRLDA